MEPTVRAEADSPRGGGEVRVDTARARPPPRTRGKPPGRGTLRAEARQNGSVAGGISNSGPSSHGPPAPLAAHRGSGSGRGGDAGEATAASTTTITGRPVLPPGVGPRRRLVTRGEGGVVQGKAVIAVWRSRGGVEGVVGERRRGARAKEPSRGAIGSEARLAEQGRVEEGDLMQENRQAVAIDGSAEDSDIKALRPKRPFPPGKGNGRTPREKVLRPSLSESAQRARIKATRWPTAGVREGRSGGHDVGSLSAEVGGDIGSVQRSPALAAVPRPGAVQAPAAPALAVTLSVPSPRRGPLAG